MEKTKIVIDNKTFKVGDEVNLYDGYRGRIVRIFEKYGADYVEVEFMVTETIPAVAISANN